MIRVDQQQLLTVISDKLQRAGLTAPHAGAVAESLVHADKRGVHSHGSLRTEYYVERLCKGGINTRPEFTITHELPSVITFDGDNGVGHFVAKQAMTRGIEIAQQQGIWLSVSAGSATVVRCHSSLNKLLEQGWWRYHSASQILWLFPMVELNPTMVLTRSPLRHLGKVMTT